MAGRDKLLAEWFWIDRWMGSSAYLLPIETRGFYREMLTQSWRRGAHLPNDHDAIRRAIGATKSEWNRHWPRIEKFWRIDGEFLVNDTQLEIYDESRQKSERASSRARAGAQARNKKRLSDTQALKTATISDAPAALEDCPPSPSPSPVRTVPVQEAGTRQARDAQAQPEQPHSRSRRPIFAGRRFKVFDWMLEDLERLLGTKEYEDFDLHTFFFDLDERTDKIGQVVPQRDGGVWLQQQVLAEAKRRGLTIASTTTRKGAEELPKGDDLWDRAREYADGRQKKPP